MALLALNHQVLLNVEVLILSENYLVYLSTSTYRIRLEILLRAIRGIRIATWQTTFPTSRPFRGNLL